MCQTLAELAKLERTHLLNEEEQPLVFERRLQTFLRIYKWQEENRKLGLEPAISDMWMPEQRQRFLGVEQRFVYYGSEPWQETYVRRNDERRAIHLAA